MPTTTSPQVSLRRGDLLFRRAALDDAAVVADILTARLPDEPMDPRAMRHWWESDDPEWTIERLVIERDGRPIGTAWHVHAPWEKQPERYARVGATYAPPDETPANLEAAHDVVERRAREDGAATLATWTREDLGAKLAFLAARGYVEKRRGKNWELDLVANQERLLALREASRAKMREQAFDMLVLADDRDPERYRKIHAVTEEAIDDVPTTIPHVREPFEQFVKWFSSPSLREDRFWLARRGDDVVGVSVLAYPPVRGNVWTEWTGTARSVRGCGVARALKLETVAQAIALGVKRVRTGNDSENAPILHLNEEMGYARIPGGVQLFKPA